MTPRRRVHRQSWGQKLKAAVNPKDAAAFVSLIVLGFGQQHASGDLKESEDARQRLYARVVANEARNRTNEARVAALEAEVARLRAFHAREQRAPRYDPPTEPLGPPEPERRGTLLAGLRHLFGGK